MIRSLFAIIAGQASIALLSGFTRIMIAIYFRSGMTLSGVSHLPSPGWAYAITALSLFYGVFGGLFTCSIAKGKYQIEILSLLLLIAALGLFNYGFLNKTEPLWYLMLSPFLKALGVYAGYKIKLTQDRTASSQAS